MLKHLDLFSGIGGWTLGFHATEQIETVGFCEIEKYPQQILKQHYPGTPIFEDVRKLDYEQLRTAGLISDTQRIDILTCSYPCQPFSVAGKKRGEEDPRHLWPEVHRLIRDDRIRPMYVLGENVGGHIRQGLDTVSEDMERSGYRWRCFSIEAACIGANHRRQRVWWIAEDTHHDSNSNSKRPHRTRVNKHRDNESNDRQERESRSVREVLANGGNTEIRETADVANTKRKPKHNQSNNRSDLESQEERQKTRSTYGSGSGQDVADTNDKRLQGWTETRDTKKSRKKRKQLTSRQGKFLARGNWDVEPNVGRVASGVPNRVHRLKALGNAIVPQMAYYIGQALLKDFQHKNHN